MTNNGVEKDTLGIDNFNQIKGIKILGKFLKKIKSLKVDHEIIYHMYDDENELLELIKLYLAPSC